MNTQSGRLEPIHLPPWKYKSAGKILGLLTVLIGTACLTMYALWDAWVHGVDPFFPIMAFVLYLYNLFGIGVMYHRYWTHRSFSFANTKSARVVKTILSIGGATALQNTILWWATGHRTHHRFSDVPGKDPHTPREYRGHPFGTMRGFWHAHFGWLLLDQPLEKNEAWNRLYRDPHVRWIDRKILIWTVLSLVVPPVLGYLWTGTVHGAWLGFVWGAGVRLFVVLHATWFVNSLCHTTGSRLYKTRDWSRDNIFVAGITGGEGWHDFHHAYETSAIHGIRHLWLDWNGCLILLLKRVGIVTCVNIPTEDEVERLRLL